MKRTKWTRGGSRVGGGASLVRSGGRTAYVVEIPEGRVRCGVCAAPAKPTSTGRLYKHRDMFGEECPNKEGPGKPVTLTEIPDVAFPKPPTRGPRTARAADAGPTTEPAPPPAPERVRVTGRCHDCDLRISGERRYCGPCASQRHYRRGR